MMNTTTTRPALSSEPMTVEAAHCAEALYQGRWARTAGLSLTEAAALHKDRAARDGIDWAVGWPSVVEGWFGDDEA